MFGCYFENSNDKMQEFRKNALKSSVHFDLRRNKNGFKSCCQNLGSSNFFNVNFHELRFFFWWLLLFRLFPNVLSTYSIRLPQDSVSFPQQSLPVVAWMAERIAYLPVVFCIAISCWCICFVLQFATNQFDEGLTRMQHATGRFLNI